MIEILKSKIHKAQVNSTNIDYEGSITIDKSLCIKANLREFEKVDVYNITNGKRFTTYVIYGKKNEIQINVVVAKLCEKGDLVITASYVLIDLKEYKTLKPKVIIMKN